MTEQPELNAARPESPANLMGADFMNGRIELEFDLRSEQIESIVGTAMLRFALQSAGFNVGVVGKATIFIYDTDMLTSELLMKGDADEQGGE